MPESRSTVASPAGYSPTVAISYGAVGSVATAVEAGHPLPVTQMLAPAASVPLTGTTTVDGSFGPFVPVAGRAIWVSLGGDWTGQVRLLRSTDGGVTAQSLTLAGEPWGVFTRPANEAVIEDGDAAASYMLAATIGGGTLNYRVSQ